MAARVNFTIKLTLAATGPLVEKSSELWAVPAVKNSHAHSTLNILIKFDIMADIVVKSISFDDTNKC